MSDTLESMYAPMLEQAGEMSNFEPESFEPMVGSIVVVVPPPKETTDGGIVLPDIAQLPAVYGRVAAVPSDPNCPVDVGDTVVFRDGSGQPLTLKNTTGTKGKCRSDILLLQYEDGPASEILGRIRKT